LFLFLTSTKTFYVFLLTSSYFYLKSLVYFSNCLLTEPFHLSSSFLFSVDRK
ncbi:unnamed protein product, partial [Brassica oleracea]